MTQSPPGARFPPCPRVSSNEPQIQALPEYIAARAATPLDILKALVFFNDGDLKMLSASEKNTLVDAVKAVRDLTDAKIISRRLGSPEIDAPTLPG